MATADINPQCHLWVLQAKISNVLSMRDKKGEPLAAEAKAPIVQELLKLMDKSLSLLPAAKENRWYHRLAEVCNILVNLLIQIKRPIIGISFLRKALLKTQSHPQEFTAIHAQLARLSLKAKCYQHNMKYFKIDFIDIKCANTTLREDVALKLEEQKTSDEQPLLQKAKSGKAKQGKGADASGELSSMLNMQKLMQEQSMTEKDIKRKEIEKKIFYTEFNANQLICYYFHLG